MMSKSKDQQKRRKQYMTRQTYIERELEKLRFDRMINVWVFRIALIVLLATILGLVNRAIGG